MKELQQINPGIDEFRIKVPVYYREQDEEVLTSIRAYALDLPLVYIGPTGSGKSTLVDHICYLLGAGFDELKNRYKKELERTFGKKTILGLLEEKVEGFQEGFPRVIISGHEDIDADTLKGRPYVMGDEAVWLNGPAKLAAEYGGILYFDEPAEARPDSLVVVHSLSDYRRSLPVEGLGKIISAHKSFGFSMSFNDKYQDPRKRFKPSTAQRFVYIPIGYPSEEVELEIVKTKVPDVDEPILKSLIIIADGTRKMAAEKKVKEGACPREVIAAAKLISMGQKPYKAALYCMAHPLSQDTETVKGIKELIATQFRD